jgi:hypothetical protein
MAGWQLEQRANRWSERLAQPLNGEFRVKVQSEESIV